ncbi:helix-turn-helix transcriptional regulator [Intestinibacillus massiliensis]|uniref:helix-turn-helix transcriptional regulator n=1 Tax=Intestinibacillus massiliensis TaxID=1871029 RepID=UPI000B3564AD|nr:helix-turn-helix transcriptional regulator [Intestinibacillus massiliensis]
MKNRIKEVRQHHTINLSQEAFGKRLGVTGAGISRIESGARNASEQIVRAICREFNINEQWLRTGKGDMFAPISDDEEFIRLCTQIQVSEDKFIRKIMRAYWELEDSEKAAVQKMVDKLIDEQKSE